MSLHLDHAKLGAAPPATDGAGLPQTSPPSHGRKPSRFWPLLSLGLRTSAVVGFVSFVAIMAAERVAPYPWKPSTMMGAFGGNQVSAHLLTELEAKRATVAAEQGEMARAQQEIIAVQAANERATQAYVALYARGTALATAWAQASTAALQLDFQTRAAVLAEGAGQISSAKDSLGTLCDIGAMFQLTPASCGDALRGSARRDRDHISDELIANFKRQSREIAGSVRDWAQGLPPDPAEVMAAAAAAAAQSMKAAPRPLPPTPPIYGKPQSPAAAL